METKQLKGEKMPYKCLVHAKGLLPLLCGDCDGPVCLDCLTTNHVGHKMCKPSECTEDTFNQLNDTIQGTKSARFCLKQIQENIQKNQGRLKDQVEEMVQRVTEREGEIVKEVKNVCQKTIKQIKELEMEIENPMKNDEEMLKCLMACDEFQNENDEEFIKCLYFYNGLKLLQEKYVARDQNDVPFTLRTCDISVEKIVELVGFVLTDEHSSSDDHSSADEDSENVEILPLLHETNINDESLPHQYKKHFPDSRFNGINLVSTEKKFLCSDENLYHLSKTDGRELVECVKDFTYVPETDEIIYVLESQASEIFRRPVSIEGEGMLLISLGDEEVLCIEHDAENYLITLTVSEKESKSLENIFELKIRFINEMGGVMKPVRSIKEFEGSASSDHMPPRFKIIQSSLMVIDTHAHKIIMTNGFEFDDDLFSYSGSIGCDPSSTFSPVDVCTDPDGNFLVIDSHDDTVHLLDPKGDFLRIIMSAEDGLSGIERIAMDSLGWFWIGCYDGTMHFANYQHFKNTTRRDRYLEKLKDKEKV